MNQNEEKTKIKAVILAAGVGSRIRPLTDDIPKSLLKIDGISILERMISHIQYCGINEVIFVLGYLQSQIREFVTTKFPHLEASFIINDKYKETNTGFFLLLAEELISGSSFIKFDEDVVFDKKILQILIESEHETCFCIDKYRALDHEEIKVIVDEKNGNRVLKASKTVDPKDAVGESIGIEKISSKTVPLLFSELKSMMSNKLNHHKYYESAYEKLIEENVPFYTIDISGLKWAEIDTEEDFREAEYMFKETD